MSRREITIHYDRSDDGMTDFAEVADILDALADRFAYNPYVHGFLITRSGEARKIDTIMQKEIPREA